MLGEAWHTGGGRSAQQILGEVKVFLSQSFRAIHMERSPVPKSRARESHKETAHSPFLCFLMEASSRVRCTSPKQKRLLADSRRQQLPISIDQDFQGISF